MGSVFSYFNGVPQNAKIIMVGLDDSGKSTMLCGLRVGDVLKSPDRSDLPTERVQFRKDGSRLTILAWDVGGSAKVRPLERHLMQGMSGLIFVVDSSDRENFPARDAATEIWKKLNEDEAKDVPLLVLANKKDKQNTFSVDELTDRLNLRQIRDRKWYIAGCCAETGDGVHEGLNWLISSILTN